MKIKCPHCNKTIHCKLTFTDSAKIDKDLAGVKYKERIEKRKAKELKK